MITLNNRKLKVKKSWSFFNFTIYLTKVGYVVDSTQSMVFPSLQEVFPSLEESEDFIVEMEKQRNLSISTYAYSRKHCLSYSDVMQIKKDWTHPGVDNNRIYWHLEGGQAVAVRVDSIGKTIEFLSLCDWSNKFNWQLPPGDWHYFTTFRR